VAVHLVHGMIHVVVPKPCAPKRSRASVVCVASRRLAECEASGLSALSSAILPPPTRLRRDASVAGSALSNCRAGGI